MPGPIAVKLRVLREKRGLTQKEAAELANVSQWTLSRLESSKLPPYMPTVTKIAGHTACPSRSWWRSSSLPYDSHRRSNLPLSRRDPLRELRLYGVLRTSQ
jgi:DNA-binding XRE family transcriptional regulator